MRTTCESTGLLVRYSQCPAKGPSPSLHACFHPQQRASQRSREQTFIFHYPATPSVRAWLFESVGASHTLVIHLLTFHLTPSSHIVVRLRDEGELIAEGKITDPARIEDYEKRTGLVAKLRNDHLIRAKDAVEAANEIAVKDDVGEALEWLRFHKEKDYNMALKLQQRRNEGEEVEVEEEDPEPDDPDVEVFVCEPPPLRGM